MATPPSIPESILGLPTTDGAVTTALANLDGTQTWQRSDDSCWWVSESAGIDVRVDVETDRIDTVFCFAEGIEDHEQFARDLPRGIAFTWTRAQIRAHLGPPDASSDEHDAWLDEDHRFIVDYDADERVTCVTVTRA